MWGELLQTVGAAGEGALDAYAWQKKYAQDERALEQRGEIAKLNAEVRAMLESMKEGGRAQRHETPSGSVVAQQEGANSRTSATNETRARIAEMNADVQRNNESGRNRRFEDSISARDIWTRLRDATARRGQDVTAGTASMRDTTTRRGQDLGAEAAAERVRALERGQDAANERARLRSGSGGSALDDPALLEAAEAAAAPGATELPPLPAPPPRALPTPAGPVPPPSSPDPARATLATQIRAAVAAVQNARTPEDRARATAALQQLRAQVPQ